MKPGDCFVLAEASLPLLLSMSYGLVQYREGTLIVVCVHELEVWEAAFVVVIILIARL